MEHFKKITASITLTTLLATVVVTSSYAAPCPEKSAATKLYNAAKRFYDDNSWVQNKGKTVAAVRTIYGGKSKIIYFVSGWDKAGANMFGQKTWLQVKIPQVRDWARALNYRNGEGFVANAGNDKPAQLSDDNGVANSSHAETQAIFRFGKISHIGIYNKNGGDMCVSCQNFYHHLFTAIKKREMVARSQNCIYRFNYEKRGRTKTFQVKGSPDECVNRVGKSPNYNSYGYQKE